MAVHGRRARRRVGALLGGVAVVSALAGCSSAGGVDTRTAMQATEAAPAPSSVTPGRTPTPAETSAPSRGVTCDVHTCTLTLRATGPREVRAMGATLTLDGVTDGVASLAVGNGKLECRSGESVDAGPLTLFCDEVTGDGVTLTAEVG